MQIGTLNIDVSEKVKDFVQYLDSTDRIILSARFGDGKTHLLNALRNDETANKEYEFFTIYPVNYSVAPNEDVFEYIKRDIIVQLNNQGLLNNIDLESILGPIWSSKDIESILSLLCTIIPYGKFFENAIKLVSDKRKEEQEKLHAVDNYLSSFKSYKGSIYEEDCHTKIIQEAIKLIDKGQEIDGQKLKGKKPVLIIEDLDRLDPKHLFRTLNVISAHMEDGNTPDKVGNKFGFNNIVLVMDYDVTKHIFHHFYGSGACYEGYMSKFLSREPFRYSIKYEVAEEIEKKMAKGLGLAYAFTIFETFRKKLSQNSIRDLIKLAQLDTNLFLRSPRYVINLPQPNETITLSSSFTIFHLLVYMIESGMTKEEIKQTFIDAEENSSVKMQTALIEYLTLVYPVYKKYYPNMQKIKLDNEYFSFCLDCTQQIQTKVEVSPIMGVSYSEFVPELNPKRVGSIINNFLEPSLPINLSALH